MKRSLTHLKHYRVIARLRCDLNESGRNFSQLDRPVHRDLSL
jgi:hypothetical protein